MTELLNEVALPSWLWQSTLCLAMGGVASYLWTRRPARGHHLLVLALVAALLVPLLSEGFRRLDWGLLTDEATVGWQDELPSVGVDSGVPPSNSSAAVAETSGGRAGVARGGPTQLQPLDMPATVSARFAWGRAALVSWIAMSGIVLIYLAVSVRLGYRLLATAEPLSDPIIDAAVCTATKALDIGTLPHVVCSDRIACPVIWAWGSTPVLLVPKSLVADSTSLDWQAIACHELAHWKRRDHLSSLFAWTSVALFPWHPLAWWARRRLHELSERACDDWVLATGRSATVYAETLLTLAPQGHSPVALAAVSAKQSLQSRLVRMLDGHKREPTAGLWWTFLLVLAASLLVSGIALAQRRSGIRTQRVERGDLSIRLIAAGVLESSRTITIRSEVQGNRQIIELAPNGMEVREGDLLVALDAANLEDEVAEAEVKLRLAREKLKAAEVILARLNDGGDDSDARRQLAEANIAAARAGVEIAERSVTKTKKQLTNCKIFSPIDGMFVHHRASGRLGKWEAKVGSRVRERQTIANVVDLTELQANVKSPASWVSAIKPGQPTTLRIDAFPNRVLKGTVKQVSESADPATWFSQRARQHAVLVAFDAPDFVPRPGLTVTAEFPVLEIADVIRIPVQAIQRSGDHSICFVRVPGGFERRQIAVGLSNNEFAEVQVGLAEGEAIAVNPRRVRGSTIQTGQGLPEASRGSGAPLLVRDPASRSWSWESPRFAMAIVEQRDGRDVLVLKVEATRERKRRQAIIREVSTRAIMPIRLGEIEAFRSNGERVGSPALKQLLAQEKAVIVAADNRLPERRFRNSLAPDSIILTIPRRFLPLGAAVGGGRN